MIDRGNRQPDCSVPTVMLPSRPCWDQAPDDFGRRPRLLHRMSQNLRALILLRPDLGWDIRTNPPIERSSRIVTQLTTLAATINMVQVEPPLPGLYSLFSSRLPTTYPHTVLDYDVFVPRYA